MIKIKIKSMNWGNKLLLVFVAFGAMISFMAYRCMMTPVNLVAKEYYKDELGYQQVIDARQKAGTLSGRIGLRQSAEFITLSLPQEMKSREVKGSVQFYCPSDASKDRRFGLDMGGSASQEISHRLLLPGRYVVRMQWESGGAHYFDEEPFVVQ